MCSGEDEDYEQDVHSEDGEAEDEEAGAEVGLMKLHIVFPGEAAAIGIHDCLQLGAGLSLGVRPEG